MSGSKGGLQPGVVYEDFVPKPAEGKTLFGVDLAKGPAMSVMQKVCWDSLAGAEHDMAAEDTPVDATITNTRSVAMFIHNPQGSNIELAPGESMHVKVPYKTLHAWQKMGGLQITLEPVPTGSGKQDAKVKNFAGVYGVHTLPPVSAETAEKMIGKFIDKYNAIVGKHDEASEHKMLDEKALGMKLATIADFETWLGLMGYAEYEVVDADGTVLVVVEGMDPGFVDDLRKRILQQTVIGLDVQVLN